MGGKKNQIHVVPHEKGWAIKKPHAKRASKVCKTQNEAWEKGKEQAKKEGNTESILHGKNGKIRETNTYHRKDDPKKTKG